MKQHCQDFRSFINILRALAIFSVVCAHTSTSDQNCYNLFVANCGTYGVGLFFFISGYFFYQDKKNVSAFTVTKLRSIVLPWFFCGTFDWLYVVLRKGNINILNWCDSIFVHSHYYYLTVLLIAFYILFRFRDNQRILFVLFLASLVSCLLTGKGLLDYIYIYVNPFNWLVYFVSGILVHKYNLLNIIVRISSKLLPILMALFIYYLAWVIWDGEFVKYWGNGNILFGLFMILMCLGSAYSLSIDDNIIKRMLSQIGSVSFTIYLIHMPLAGIISKVIDVTGADYLRIFAPPIVIIITIITIYLIMSVSKLLRVQHYVKYLIGIR